jgi:polyisoprenoid-binding protein YceI
MSGSIGGALLTALLVAAAVLRAGTEAPQGTAAPAGPAPAGLQRFVIIPGESQVVYRVGEVLFSENNRFNIAVGTTTVVRGEILVDRANPRISRIGTITVDISQFRSDSQRRDNFIRTRSLESARFPTAEFTPTEIQGLPEVYADSRELHLQVMGNLKIRDVSRPATFATTIRINGVQLTGIATTTIKMTDFGFDPPSILGMLRTENEAKLEFRIVARASQ